MKHNFDRPIKVYRENLCLIMKHIDSQDDSYVQYNDKQIGF